MNGEHRAYMVKTRFTKFCFLSSKIGQNLAIFDGKHKINFAQPNLV